MRVVHESGDGDRQVLASRAETADGIVSQGLGLMFRRSLPEEYALAFRFDGATTRSIHMLFVLVPLDVLWVREGVVERVERLDPWRGFARADADLILELPAGAAAGVAEGDRVRLKGA